MSQAIMLLGPKPAVCAVCGLVGSFTTPFPPYGVDMVYLHLGPCQDAWRREHPVIGSES